MHHKYTTALRKIKETSWRHLLPFPIANHGHQQAVAQETCWLWSCKSNQYFTPNQRNPISKTIEIYIRKSFCIPRIQIFKSDTKERSIFGRSRKMFFMERNVNDFGKLFGFYLTCNKQRKQKQSAKAKHPRGREPPYSSSFANWRDSGQTGSGAHVLRASRIYTTYRLM